VSLPFVSLIVFVAASCVITAVLMIIRDLIVSSRVAGDGTASLPLNLRRPLTVADEAPARGFSARIDQAFDRLVLESGLDASSFGAFAFVLLCGLGVGGALFLWNENPLGGLIGMAAGMGCGLWYLIQTRIRRRREIVEQLPDVLDLMSRAVRAGESLDQAVELVGNETPAPLGTEFLNCARQLEMGMSISGAMRGLMRRNRLMEMRILATTLMVHRQTGGNLALTLERMAGVVRERVSYQRQIRATTGAGRMSAALISIAAPVLFLILFFWQFQHLKIMLDTPVGQSFMILAIILEVVGIVWVTRLFKTE